MAETPGESMDFLNLLEGELYFNTPTVAGTEALIREAAALYGTPEAENRLLRAYFLAPEQLSVLVALYRYYFYQHRLDDTFIVAERAIALAARQLGLPTDWQALDEANLAAITPAQVPLLRFHLLALKGSAVVLLRLDRCTEARARLKKLVALDTRNQLDVRPLLEVVDAALAENDPPLNLAA